METYARLVKTLSLIFMAACVGVAALSLIVGLLHSVCGASCGIGTYNPRFVGVDPRPALLGFTVAFSVAAYGFYWVFGQLGTDDEKAKFLEM